MKHLRLRLIFLAGWLMILFSADRLFNFIQISNLAYLFTFLAVVFVIPLKPRLHGLSLQVLSPFLIFLLLRTFSWIVMKSAGTVVSLVEIALVAVTTLLVYWTNISLTDFESAVSIVTIGRWDKLPEVDSSGQGYLYREVRRARNHQRPLEILAVCIDEKSIKGSTDQVLQEIQYNMVKQYKLSNLAKVLREELEDCSIITQSEDYFLIALPETKPDDTPFIVDRLRKEAAREAGVNIIVGRASLGKDNYTFEGLVDKATSEMKAVRGGLAYLELEPISSKENVRAIK